MEKGWECPICSKIWAPFIESCTCKSKKIYDLRDDPRCNIFPLFSLEPDICDDSYIDADPLPA